MPTNLPIEAKDKWEEVEATNDPRKKLVLLEEFLSLVPKHHGTSRLCVQVKKQIAGLRKQVEEKKRKKSGKSGPKVFIQKEGAAQIALIGLTKAGKSSLLLAVTNAKVLASPDPYTTREPMPGILDYEDVQFQIVEAPALMERSAEGRAWGLQTLGIARNADGIIIIVDLSQDPVKQLSLVLNELEKARVLVRKPKSHVEVERKHTGAGLRIILVGTLAGCSFREVEEMLKNYNFTDGEVRISGDAALNDIEDAIFETTVYKPAVIVANKRDLPETRASLDQLQQYVNAKLPIIAVSCATRIGLERLGRTLFETLGIMRIYTKEPNERTYSQKPFVLKNDATIYELARSIHTDLSRRFAFAKVWAKRLPYSPQKVGANFVLRDGDVVEIHVK